MRRFVSPLTAATLNSWGAHDGSPITLYVERNEGSFYVASRQYERLRVEVRPETDAALPKLPRLGETRL